MKDTGHEATGDVKGEEPPPAEGILYIVSEEPEEPHIPGEVQDAGVEELGGDTGEEARPSRNEAVAEDNLIIVGPEIEAQIDTDVQGDQGDRESW